MRNVTLLIKPASSLCNMRCDYCFYADVAKRREMSSHGVMARDVLETLTRRAFAFAEESLTFVFQGGEPLLAGLDFFKEAIRLQKKYAKRGVRTFNSIQTNGILIDNEWAEFFRENDFLVGVSLDGFEEIHDRYRHLPTGGGSFSRAAEGLRILEEHRVDFNVLTVVSADVARNARAVWKSLRRYAHLQFIPLIDDADGAAREFTLTAKDYGRFLTELFDEYARDIRSGHYVSVRNFDAYVNALRGIAPSDCAMRGTCGGYFAIEADGGIYPCDFYMTDEYRLGDVCETSFFAASESAALKRFVEDSRAIDEACRHCRHYPLCRGGCRRYREPFPAPSKFCEAYKTFFDASLDKMLNIAKSISALSARGGGAR